MTGESVPALVRHLYAVVSELEERFPSRKFTPEGQLVGSIGEVLAAHHYGLKLHPASAPDHDATAPDGTMVQVAATQAELVGLRAEPERLLVLSLRRDGSFSEVYNGPGRDAWEAAGKMQENGQRPISLSKLARLMEQVPKSGRLPRT